MKNVLITGTTNGLGKEFAQILANQKDYHLILVSRDIGKLAAQKAQFLSHGIDVEIIPLDCSLPLASKTLIEKLEELNLKVDILINNVGFDISSPLEKLTDKEIMDMFHILVGNLVLLTKSLLPYMKDKHDGKILNVSSVAAFFPMPNNTVYSACKAFVMNFSIALNSELKGSGVTCSCLYPGPTETGFATRAGLDETKIFKNAYDPHKVAVRGIKGMMKGKVMMTYGFVNKVQLFFGRILPRSIVDKIVRDQLSEK